MEPLRAILLPGSVLPAGPAYGALIEALGPDVHAVAKDLELYTDDAPPPGWTLDTEGEGVLREADRLGWETFHLVGYSGGGAAALALTARDPERFLSLTLLEAAWAGNWDWSPAHAALWKEYGKLESLPPEQFMPAFMRLGVKSDVVLGGLSNPDDYGEVAGRLGTVFPDFTLEVFEDRHHFDPPHRIEPGRLAGMLRRHWERAEELGPS